MQNQPPNSGRRQLRLEMPKNPNATYANTVMISHTQNEVIFDFIQVMPNDPRARIQHRIVMTPTHAKMFMKALDENVKRYETKHGDIKLPPRPESLAEQLFRSVRPGENPEDESDDDE